MYLFCLYIDTNIERVQEKGQYSLELRWMVIWELSRACYTRRSRSEWFPL